MRVSIRRSLILTAVLFVIWAVVLGLYLRSVEKVKRIPGDITAALNHATEVARATNVTFGATNQAAIHLNAQMLASKNPAQEKELDAQTKGLLAEETREIGPLNSATAELVRLTASLRPAQAKSQLFLRIQDGFLLGLIIASIYSGSLMLWRQLRKAQQLCVECGYDLRASTIRCPECGTEFAAGTVLTAQ